MATRVNHIITVRTSRERIKTNHAYSIEHIQPILRQYRDRSNTNQALNDLSTMYRIITDSSLSIKGSHYLFFSHTLITLELVRYDCSTDCIKGLMTPIREFQRILFPIDLIDLLCCQ